MDANSVITLGLLLGFYFGGAAGYYRCGAWSHGQPTFVRVLVSAAWLAAAGFQAGRWVAQQPSIWD